ncbi:MAG: bifunctional phosphopantothenoylcysteine decarboxylase/phosphopantothenate--cysteine ligase CoaBC [Bacteroidetes bacterium]|nr:bifunctional phosphopantothenoylcysteine decarboxylase/phosphopantothenate--cysteine ligase CoaBC [Bacteroidota bacterium]
MKGKKILVGVTGSIACIKTTQLVRMLVKSGAEVKVVMTTAAQEFILPLTFASLSGHSVVSDFTEKKESGEWTNHVHWALWADAMIIAPCSAHTLSKMATGLCDNFLMAVYMSTRCPIFVAPAMDHDMFLHAGTQTNLDSLQKRGHHVLAPQEGSLASGLDGKGRMMEPEEIYTAVLQYFAPNPKWEGKKILITAGPTHEAIDPVRFIGNHSSGKMGFALAERAAESGAEVVLITGPTALSIHHPLVQRISVTSADEMAAACEIHFPHCHAAILSAAVADFKPATIADQKMKKKDQALTIALVPTIDIAQTLGQKKQSHQRLVGFALETENLLPNAMDKMTRKNFDFIVANSALGNQSGFGKDDNTVTIIYPDSRSLAFEPMHKTKVAQEILNQLCEIL